MAHHAIKRDAPPEKGEVVTGYGKSLEVGDNITFITPGGLRYGTVAEKDLPGYVSPVQVADHQEPRDLGKGYARIEVTK